MWQVHTKLDRKDVEFADIGDSIGVSVSDAQLFGAFVAALTKRIEASFGASVTNNVVKSRYLDHLKVCNSEILTALSERDALELRVENLRRAAFSLGRITGQHNTEDVLGRIFSSFCIGK